MFLAGTRKRTVMVTGSLAVASSMPPIVAVLPLLTAVKSNASMMSPYVENELPERRPSTTSCTS